MMHSEMHHSVETKQKLVAKLLESQTFKSNAELQRLLATYPSEMSERRCKTVSAILNTLLPQFNGFDSYANFDLILGLNKTRGHFIHQFEVFLLGLNIISMNPFGFINIASKESKIQTYDALVSTWAFAATGHDIGYPMSAAKEVSNAIAALYGSISLPEVSDIFKELDPLKKIVKTRSLNSLNYNGSRVNIDKFIIDCLKQFVASSKIEEFLKVVKEQSNHGYTSAVLLTRIMFDYYNNKLGIKKFKKTWEYDALRFAVGGITLHSLDYKKDVHELFINADSKKNIFAYLLFIVDNIQDYDRNIFEDTRYPDYILKDVSLEYPNYTIEYYVTHDKWTTQLTEEAMKFIEGKEKMKNSFTAPGLNLEVLVRFSSDNPAIYRDIKIPI